MKAKPSPLGFVVIGSSGPMALSRKGILYFGFRRGSVVTVFASRRLAEAAVKRALSTYTETTGQGSSWIDPRIVRLERVR